MPNLFYLSHSTDGWQIWPPMNGSWTTWRRTR